MSVRSFAAALAVGFGFAASVSAESFPFALTNEHAVVAFDSLGRFASVRETKSARELVRERLPFFVAHVGGKRIFPDGFSVRGGRLAWTFPGGGAAEMSVAPFAGGWTFKAERVAIPNATKLEAILVRPICNKWVGNLANLFSDERSGVALRGYDFRLTMFAHGPAGLSVSAKAEDGALDGWRAGLVVAPRDSLAASLRAMTLESGVAWSPAGGAWALESPSGRASYLFAAFSPESVDDWISAAERGGFRTIHHENWYARLGDYPINKNLFPNGLADLTNAVARLHASGLNVGLHTLTGCVNPLAPWVTPQASPMLAKTRTYTLARPFATNDVEMVVEEMPADGHDVVFTYMGNGNVFRIGGELVQYTGVRREKPYAFTGVKRGAFNTAVGGTWPAGTKADYLRQRYIAFYPDPDSKLADDVADSIARSFVACGADQIYCDGTEGMGPAYACYTMRDKVTRRLVDGGRHPVAVEASSTGAGSWWAHSRIGAWDNALWGHKRFVDRHVASTIPTSRDANLLVPQLGWWAALPPSVRSRRLLPDEMEYFAAKVAAHDAAMSLHNFDVTRNPLTFAKDELLTTLGWWERARLARAFESNVVERLKTPGRDFRLRQDATGTWTVQDVDCSCWRVASADCAAWKVKSDAPRKAELRIEALYCADPAKADAAPLVGPNDVKQIKTTAAKGLKAETTVGADSAHGPSVRLAAENANSSAVGAWAIARLDVPAPYRKTQTAFGAWVKGDGSGALLNLQLCNPREFAACFDEHYLRLDFVGWRFVTFLSRERDAAASADFKWPYGQDFYAVFRYHFQPEHLSSVALALNEVPAGGRAAVEVADFRAYAPIANELADVAVAVGGKRVAVPFALRSGECAELVGGFWTRYAEDGEPLERKAADGAVELAKGETPFAFEAKGRGGLPARAEVTTFALGDSRPAFDVVREGWKDAIGYEAAAPCKWAPSRGFASLPALAVRPGEKARLEIEITGAADKPTLAWTAADGVGSRTFPVTLKKGDKLVCRDGRAWRVTDRKRKTLAEGTLEKPLPIFSGVTPLKFSSADGANADVRIDLVKRYVPSFTVMSFNLAHCVGMDGRQDLARVARTIKGEQPRFAALQELDVNAERSGFVDEPAELGRLTGMHATFAKSIPLGGGEYGVALLSREKPLAVKRVPLPGVEPRALLVAEFADCRVACTHLDLDERKRLESLPIIERELAGCGKPTIICGDWNAWQDSEVLKRFCKFVDVKSELLDATFHGLGAGGVPSRDTGACIDYIAVDNAHADSFERLGAWVVEDRISSDHAPIAVRFGASTLGEEVAKGTAGERENVVFVGAHPDDTEGFAATAFLLKEKYNVHVIDLTRGEWGLGREGAADGSTARRRVAEEQAAWALLGSRPRFLCEVDGSATASRESARKLAALLRELRPKAVFTHWPVDRHADHVQTAATVANALRFSGVKCERYFFEVLLSQTRNWRPRYSVDVSSTIGRKQELLRRYVCQNDKDSLAQVKTEQAKKRGTERVPPCAAAETFTTFDGEPLRGGVLESLPQTATLAD